MSMPTPTQSGVVTPPKRTPLRLISKEEQRDLENRGTLTLHGCGLVRQGQAYLFLARSGGGKSTLAGLSGRHADCLSDEHLILGTSGALSLGAPPCCPVLRFPQGAPLAAGFVLEKHPALKIRPLASAAFAATLMRELYPSTWEENHARRLLLSAVGAASRLPTYVLGFSLSTPPEDLWNAIDRLPTI